MVKDSQNLVRSMSPSVVIADGDQICRVRVETPHHLNIGPTGYESASDRLDFNRTLHLDREYDTEATSVLSHPGAESPITSSSTAHA